MSQYLGQEMLLRIGKGQRLVDGHKEAVGLAVDVANVDAALVVEEDLVSLALRVDADIVLVRGLVRHKGLDDERLEHAADVAGGHGLVESLADPLLGVVPGGVEQEEARLAAAFDELAVAMDGEPTR